jgi:hypothetical protein
MVGKAAVPARGGLPRNCRRPRGVVGGRGQVRPRLGIGARSGIEPPLDYNLAGDQFNCHFARTDDFAGSAD